MDFLPPSLSFAIMSLMVTPLSYCFTPLPLPPMRLNTNHALLPLKVWAAYSFKILKWCECLERVCSVLFTILHTWMYPPDTSLSDHVRILDSPLGDDIIFFICGQYGVVQNMLIKLMLCMHTRRIHAMVVCSCALSARIVHAMPMAPSKRYANFVFSNLKKM